MHMLTSNGDVHPVSTPLSAAGEGREAGPCEAGSHPAAPGAPRPLHHSPWGRDGQREAASASEELPFSDGAQSPVDLPRSDTLTLGQNVREEQILTK